MEDILAGVKDGLYEKGYINPKLLGNGMLKSGLSFKFLFFGLKDGKLAIIPYVDYNNITYSEIKYYAKEDIKSIKFSDMSGVLRIKFADGDSHKYQTLRVGKQDFLQIISMFDP